MSGNLIRSLVASSLMIVIAGCNSPNPGFGTKAKVETNDPSQPVIVQGACPQVYLREGTSFFTEFAKGAKRAPDGSADPEKLRYQATLVQTTRQCRQTDAGLVVTVVAYGRLIAGPAGAPGTVTMPIRVAASDGDAAVYSEMTQYPVELPAGQGSTQFIFTKADVLLAGGIGPLTKLFVGFDEGPYNTK